MTQILAVTLAVGLASLELSDDPPYDSNTFEFLVSLVVGAIWFAILGISWWYGKRKGWNDHDAHRNRDNPDDHDD